MARFRFCLGCRVFILGLLGVSVAWVPVIEHIQGGEMYIYIQSVAAYLSPPIAAVYCMALFNKRMTEPESYSLNFLERYSCYIFVLTAESHLKV